MRDSERLQHDATSVVARAVCNALGTASAVAGSRLTPATGEAPGARALAMLSAWDHVLSRDSAAAALYELWMPLLSAAAARTLVPLADQPYAGASMSTDQLLAQLARVETDVRVQELLVGAPLDEAWREATRQMGADAGTWAWGRIHHASFEHPLASTAARREIFNLPDAPRGGDGNTPFATGAGSRQTSGASFREVIDLADWDTSTTINVPGESGQPTSRFYGNLLPLWAAEQYHPMLYSREAVLANAAVTLVLTPPKK